MLYSYIYSKTSDFSGNINLDNLHSELKGSSLSVKKFDGISINDDNVKILFNLELTPEEEMVLSSLITNHNSVEKINVKVRDTLLSKFVTVNETVYKKIVTYMFKKDIYKGISNIKVISYMDSSVTSYDIKIYNLTENSEISTSNFTNVKENANVISDLPSFGNFETLIEIHMRRNGGPSNSKIYIDSIIFELN